MDTLDPLTMRGARRMFRQLRKRHLNVELSFRSWARSSHLRAGSPKLARIVGA